MLSFAASMGCRRVMGGDDMSFLLLGFFMGMLTAFGLLGFLIYWLCCRSNNVAVAKFILGIAQALAHKRKSPEPPAPSKNGELMEEARPKKSGG